MSVLNRPPVDRVRKTLLAAGHDDTIIELDASAKTAVAAAGALGCELGAIVKSLVFCIDARFVLALIAGDHECLEENLPGAFNIKGTIRRPQASEVKAITGFSIGGVAPIGLNHPLPTVMDISLRRFETIYAAAGHPSTIFSTSVADLKNTTGALLSYNVAKAADPANSYAPKRIRSKTFREQNA